ncbi:survival motor neuron protein [Aricia agestis]|uniref:survival motor neuron protein n=1 Tax=Aricia agestis TaxID=91739 RepID=UPI001C20C0DB|nr:survival motor neuron protein [Aricia agestis]
MTSNNVLYMKGMHLSGSEQEIDEEDEDIWDDRKLNDAYDKALKMANAEVAKRIAMSTNTQGKDKHDKSKNTATKHSDKSSKKELTQWKAGMHCRAVYDEDGIEYEALLMRVINEKECIVRFLGYNNTEIVEINSLKPSLGKLERTRQIEDTLLERTDDACSEVSQLEKMECSDRAFSVASSETIQKKKKSSKKKKSKQKNVNGFNIPNLPMPDLTQLNNLGSLDMPIPPPPPMLYGDSEDQAVSSMLLSWYMSGYYTGLYQGMRRAKSQRYQ